MSLRRVTLRRSLILMALAALLAPAVVVNGLSWWQRYEDIHRQTADALQSNAAALADGMSEPLSNSNRANAVPLIEAMMNHNRDIIRILVLDNTSGIFLERTRSERRGGYSTATVQPVIYGGKPIGAVEIEMGSTSSLLAFKAELKRQLIELAAQALLSITLILLLLEKRLVSPLQKLTQGAAKLARQELDMPFEHGTRDEMGLLALRLEETRVSLKALFDQLNRKNQELEEDNERRKRAEKALQMSEAKFAGAFECNPDSITIARVRDKVLVDVNQAFIRLSGYTRDEAVGKTVEELQVWVDLGQREALVDRLRTERVVRDIECDFLDKAGQSHQCVVNATLFEVENEMFLLAVTRSVNAQRAAELERIQAQEALRLSEQRFSTIFQSSPMAMFLTLSSGDHPIRDVNHAFEKLFLRRREEAIGKSSLSLGMYEDPGQRLALIADFAHSDVSRRHEIWMVRGDGVRMFVAILGHSFVLEGERYVIVACEDITEKHRIEQQIRELNANLEQRVAERTEELQKANCELASTLETLNMAHEELVRSEKLAALGSLVAGIAHELNTPIGNSLMAASTLEDQTKEFASLFTSGSGMKRSALENYLRSAETAGDILARNLERAAHLVSSFKQVAADQASSQRRRFLLSEVVMEIVITLRPSFRRTAYKIEQQLPHDLAMDSYPGPLGQVLTNLINNALLHAFEGRDTGRIMIEAHAVEERAVELNFSDDGVGIPPANLGRIFDPFFTTKLGAGGSGLGLNIVHNMVTGILGGRLRVHSTPGTGTTFTMTLPLSAPHRQSEDAATGTA